MNIVYHSITTFLNLINKANRDMSLKETFPTALGKIYNKSLPKIAFQVLFENTNSFFGNIWLYFGIRSDEKGECGLNKIKSTDTDVTVYSESPAMNNQTTRI